MNEYVNKKFFHYLVNFKQNYMKLRKLLMRFWIFAFLLIFFLDYLFLLQVVYLL